MIDNGPARSGDSSMAQRLHAAGTEIGEPCEISNMRKEVSTCREEMHLYYYAFYVLMK